MTYSICSWTDRDTGIDREISQSIYPEYRKEPRHPAWFPARQLGAPRETSSRYVVVDSRNGERVAYARFGYGALVRKCDASRYGDGLGL